MNFPINNKLTFIDSFQFLSPFLDSLVKNIDKDDFKYLSQEFYLFEFMTDFKKLKEKLLGKKKVV